MFKRRKNDSVVIPAQAGIQGSIALTSEKEWIPACAGTTKTASRHDGFTLIEMMVTLTLLALLALAVVPVAQLSARQQKEADLRHALHDIRTAIDAWKQAVDENRIARDLSGSGYPPTLSALADGTEDLRSPSHPLIRFLRRLPRDPFANPQLSAEQSWGLRSYASPAEAPRAGEDVYDVYSLSEETGSDGRPYREW